MVPFAKTGGLADVAGALPGALKRLEVDARLALPLYRMIRGKDLDMRLVLENLNVPISNDSEAWKTIVANGMKADFSWDGSATSYLEPYRSFNDPPFIHQEQKEKYSAP